MSTSELEVRAPTAAALPAGGPRFGKGLGTPAVPSSSFAVALGLRAGNPKAPLLGTHTHGGPNNPPFHPHRDPRERIAHPEHEEDPLDPSARRAAQLAPPTAIAANPATAPSLTSPAPITPPVAAGARVSLEELLPALVRRIAWSGDGRRGTVRLELGAGAFAGATVMVHAEQGVVRVELTAPHGVDAENFRARIADRLAARGIDLEGVEIVG